MTELVYIIPPMVGLFLVWAGMQYNEYVSGVFGGLVLFLYGVGILLNPIPTFQGLINTFLGTTMLGYGAYVFIRGGVEEIKTYI